MRGYPKHINTKHDYLNLMSVPEFSDRAKTDLQKLIDASPAKVTRAIRPVKAEEPGGEWETEEIVNPAPLWKLKGFKTKTEVLNLIKGVK
jgi:hypothetical protein